MALARQLVSASTIFHRCGLHVFRRTTDTTYFLRCYYYNHGNPLGRRLKSSSMPWNISSLDERWRMEWDRSTFCQQRPRTTTVGLQMSQRHYSQPPWQGWPLGKLDQPKKKDFKEPTSSSIVPVLDMDSQEVKYLERLHDAETPPEVLAVLQEGGYDLTSVHYGRALGRLADIYHDKKQEEGLDRSTMIAPVLYDSRFRHLCHIVLQQSRHLENGLYLDTLEALQRLKIHLKSSMMYTFLVQAEQRVNTFNAAELAQFAGILSRYDQRNPRVHALVDAVSILAPRHINDLRTLHHTLSLTKVVGSSLDGVSRGKLANMLLAILAADEERSLEHITQAVLALHKMEYKLDILLELACPLLTEEMQDLSDTNLYNLLCAFSGLCHADQDFFQAASKRILEDIDKWNASRLINVAEAYSVVEIPAPLLLDCTIRRVMDRGVNNINLIDMTKLISSLNALGHRPPPSWDFEQFATKATSSLVLDTSRLSSADCRTVLTLAHSLATLGYFPTDLWELLTSRKFANWFMMVKDGKEYKTMVNDIKSLTQLLKDSQHDASTVWSDGIEKLITLQ